MKHDYYVFQYIILSLIAALLLLLIASLNFSKNIIETNDRIFVSGLFIISCLIGISLAFYPGWIRKSIKERILGTKRKNIQKPARKREGHHPNCERFKNHTIKIKKNVYCAGCLGLVVGCVISIILTFFYILNPIKISSDTFPKLK